MSNSFDPPPPYYEAPRAGFAVKGDAAELSYDDPDLPERSFGCLGFLIAGFIWLAIAAFITFSLFSPYRPDEDRKPEDDYTVAGIEQAPVMLDVGMRSLDPKVESSDELADPTSDMPAPYLERLARTVITLERSGPTEAREQLLALDEFAEQENFTPNSFEQRRRETLGRLFQDVENGDYELPSVSNDDREDLVKGLGWSGELALEPPGSPQASPKRTQLIERAARFCVTMVAVVLGVSGLFIAGIFACIISIVLLATRRLKFKPVEVVGRGTVYLETFGLWLLVFTVGSALIQLSMPGNQLLGALLGSLLSIGTLIWPLMRGVPMGEMLRDIGWRCESLPREVFSGIWGYVSALPVIAGFLFLYLLVYLAGAVVLGGGAEPGLFERPEGPSHPINDLAKNADWSELSMLFILAVVMAPIVEETFFRGVLYRHLREVSNRWHRWGSALVSALVTGFVFAAIHPQGVLLIPPLGMLGMIFAFLREWRGSIVASMTAHAMHNGILVTILFLMLSATTV